MHPLMYTLVAAVLLFAGSLAKCNLSSYEELSLNCSNMEIVHPSNIFLGQAFSAYLDAGDLSLVNASLFNNSYEYCGPDSFPQGLQCNFTETIAFSRYNIVINCEQDSTYITPGEVALVLGFSGSMNCSVALAVTLNQTTFINIVQNNEVFYNVLSNNHYIVEDSETPVNISCKAVPKGSDPVLTFKPFNSSETVTFQTHKDTNSAIIGIFPNGIYSSGVIECASPDGYSTQTYITPLQDLPLAYYPMGNSQTITVGGFLNITVVLLTEERVDLESVFFSSVEGYDSNSPYIETFDELHYQIIFNNVGVPPVESHQLCFNYAGSGDEMTVNTSSCTQIFNLNVTVPSTNLSSNLTVHFQEDFENGMVNISCLPSDPATIVFWQLLNKTALWEVYPDLLFSPFGLNHTVTVVTPPNGIETFVCGLYNNEDNLLNEQRATIVAVTRPVSIWNKNMEILQDAVINTFQSENDTEHPDLSLRCFSTIGNEVLYWKSNNVSNLPLEISSNTSITGLEVVTRDRDTTLRYADLDNQKTGYYSCASDASGIESTVFITTDNPYWSITTPMNIKPPIGTNVSIIMQYAYNSEGYGNTGQNFLFDLKIEPYDSEPYTQYTDMFSDPNLYQYNYNFTAGSKDRAVFVFQAQYGNVSFSSNISVYSIVPQFTYTSTPVYGRLGSLVSLSCIANQTTAPIIWGIWNYEEYIPLNDEPGFSFSPPVINEDISFNISTKTLGNGENFFYDVDSGSYDQLRFACGFKDGVDEGLFNPNVINLNIRQYNIQVENINAYATIYNNSIVNSFNIYYMRKRNIENINFFNARCTTVQGNHKPIWKAEFFNELNYPVIINDSFSDELYSYHENSYISELNAYVTEDIGGAYRCESSITGVFVSFILTSKNPFVMAKSQRLVNGFLGDTITITFWAALNSDGSNNRESEIEVIFSDINNNEQMLEAVKECNSDNKNLACFEYQIKVTALQASAGLYTGRLGKCFTHDNGTEVCNYAHDTINLTVEVPDLIPSHVVHKIYVGQPLSLSCTPSQGDFIIIWQHNGILIPGLHTPNKRNILKIILSPAPYNYDLFLSIASLDDAGIYSCSLTVDGDGVIQQEINVTISQIPSVVASTNLSVHLREEFENGLVNITCTPSDLSAVISWESPGRVPLHEIYGDATFSPLGLNHTISFASAPTEIVIAVCGLYNNGGKLLNKRTVTVVALSRPVSVWNNNKELLPNAVINVFRNFFEDNLPFLSLRCFSVSGNGLLYWKTTNVSALPSVLSADDEIENLTIVSNDHDITINYAAINDLKTGYYSCVSEISKIEFSVSTTLDNPHWSITTPMNIKPPIGTNASIIMQYAYNSEGYGNTGQNFLFDLTIKPINSEPFSQFTSLVSDPNQYLFYHNLTASRQDRAVFVFQAHFGNTSFSSSVSVYSIVPQFTLVSTPVYGRLGGVVNMSCIANETSAPIIWGIWNYEEYIPLNDEPGFSFSPPVINEDISFNISTKTLGNGENFFYDVDSGSYSQLRFACGFKDGKRQDLFTPKIVLLNIRQFDIQINSINEYNDALQNNSIVNDFQNYDYYDYNDYRKRNVEYPHFFQVQCTTVQGNHDPIWKAEFFNRPNYPGVITNKFSEELYSNEINPYVSELRATVAEDLSGKYMCESLVSGVYITFILTIDNPFVKAKSVSNISGILGDKVAIVFYAAIDSNGYSSNKSFKMLEITFIQTNGSNQTLYALNDCDHDGVCFEYSLSIDVLLPVNAGNYTGRLGKCEPNEFIEDVVCTYATDTVSLSVEVPVLNPSHSNVTTFVGDLLQLSCLPSSGNYNISWYHNDTVITNMNCEQEQHNKRRDIEACLFPPPYNTNLSVLATSINDSGIYQCRLVVAGETILNRSINVTVKPRPLQCYINELCKGDILGTTESIGECCVSLRGGAFSDTSTDQCILCPKIYCGTDYSAGILWNVTAAGTYADISCQEAGNQFSPFALLTRYCSHSGIWESVELTNCTLKPNVSSFASISIVLAGNEIEDVHNNENILEENMRDLLDSFNLTYQNVRIKAVIEATSTIDFEIEFTTLSSSDISSLADLQSSLLSSASFANYLTEASKSSLYVLRVADSCPCESSIQDSEIDLTTKCSTSSIRNPCQCSNEICKCATPYVGDGILCTIDTDGDMYPDEPLETCTAQDNKKFCLKDNCVAVYNPDQNPSACTSIPDFSGCNFVTDSTWGIEWANTEPGLTDTQPCPPGSIGKATRFCSSNGIWEEPIVINCLPEIYQTLLDQANSIFSSTADIQVRVAQATRLTQDLAQASSEPSQNTASLLPASINATNEIAAGILNLLFESLESGVDVSEQVNGIQLAVIFSNLLEENQLNGWTALHTTGGNNSLGSDILLQNAEDYGRYLALTRNDTVIRMSNIAIRAKQYSVFSDSLFFPQPGDLDGLDFPPNAAYVQIPSDVLSQRAEDGVVPVVSILFRNMQRFLETTDRNDTNESRPASLVWSGQISSIKKGTPEPINLTFGVNADTNLTHSFRCVFWDGVESKWSTIGVTTVGSRVDKNGSTVVDCESIHLTPFAVLVDVSGSIQDTSSAHYKALQGVSYIGCAISLAGLLATIIFFLTLGKKLFTSVHFFVHLNLAISLFCGYFVFAVGVETARGNQAGCGFVAALLHYFFLASFCWMLCEGIMLYLMLVMVFSSLSKRWYIFLTIGWVPPLLPVIIGLAAGYNQYGVRDENGDLQFCWLSTKNGVIWAFVAPMIIIILVNIVFLVLALRSIWKSRGSKYVQKKNNIRDLALSLFKATAILLPLLGLTWLFGLLVVDGNSLVFAWIFTLLNSFQGTAIFFFHVIRSDRVWSKISPYLKKVKGKTSGSKSYDLTSTSSTTTLKYRGSTIKFNSRNPVYSMNTLKKNKPDTVNEADEFEGIQNSDEPEKTILTSGSDEQERIREKEKEVLSFESEANTSAEIENKV